ncbi:hypothetical protein PFICI_09394 [Pestalotiopsis fici W106-1]|uniref:Glutamyl-tRNA amidotransferase complex subunit Gta3 domain-containing protein n=1 Tax=Pestalotiopsis fici (strain W106-1 / CGMCC3.15140) TaxID=1229662 RepID=W3X316_PESFW|nr:uncharacterized protein PFICI_09394 [Pestalotiopsis fici W106-1]ETS79541.1 hypothetical protein PFICI_09394 [Pestalotiopsis fici W106-1]
MSITICSQCRTALRLQRGTSRRAIQPAIRQQNLSTFSSPSKSLFEAQCQSKSRPFSTTSARRIFAPDQSRDPSPEEILAKPTWSVRSLLPPSSSNSSSSPAVQTAEEEEEITPQTLRHLLRLSALPPPATEAEESQLLGTLRAQLHFVRSIQSIDTTGVQPLVSIRDETTAGVSEQTVGLADLEGALAAEDVVGHAKRPRRRRTRSGQQIEGVEDWDVLKGASEKVGRYFVVRSGPGK